MLKGLHWKDSLCTYVYVRNIKKVFKLRNPFLILFILKSFTLWDTAGEEHFYHVSHFHHPLYELSNAKMEGVNFSPKHQVNVFNPDNWCRTSQRRTVHVELSHAKPSCCYFCSYWFIVIVIVFVFAVETLCLWVRKVRKFIVRGREVTSLAAHKLVDHAMGVWDHWEVMVLQSESSHIICNNHTFYVPQEARPEIQGLYGGVLFFFN